MDGAEGAATAGSPAARRGGTHELAQHVSHDVRVVNVILIDLFSSQIEVVV